MKKWNIEHRTSSPTYAQSNGRAESAVKEIKKLLRGSWDTRAENLDWDKVCQGILMFCNTPRYDGRSPAQVLFGHPIRDLLPAHRRAFASEWQKAADIVEEKANAARQHVAKYYNATARELQPLKVQDRVVVQSNVTKRWEKHGIIVEMLKNRDYLIRLNSGRVLRRNRRFIRRRLPVLATEVAQRTTEPTDTQQQRQPQQEQPRIRFKAQGPLAERQNVQTRSGRLIRPPDRLLVDPSKKRY